MLKLLLLLLATPSLWLLLSTLLPPAGEWVLQNRPAAVVVETACTPEHGAEPGRGVTCRDQVQGKHVLEWSREISQRHLHSSSLSEVQRAWGQARVQSHVQTASTRYARLQGGKAAPRQKHTLGTAGAQVPAWGMHWCWLTSFAVAVYGDTALSPALGCMLRCAAQVPLVCSCAYSVR